MRVAGSTALVFVLAMAAVAVHAASDAAFSERDFAVAEGQLPGTLSVPAGSGPFPVVVLVHGSGPNDRDQTIGPNRPFRDLAHGLATHGIAVLRYEKRTRVRPADFAGNDFTVELEVVADALAAIREVAVDPMVDPDRVFVLGHSLGALLAPRIAQREPLAGMILVAAPARPLEDIVVEQVAYILGLDPDNAGRHASQLDMLRRQREEVRSLSDPAATGLMLGLPATYWMDLSSYDPVGTAVDLDAPMLVLHGGRDYQVTDADFELWQQGLADHPQATLVRHADLNHLMMTGEGMATPAEYLRAGEVEPRLIAQVAEWIGQRSPVDRDGQ